VRFRAVGTHAYHSRVLFIQFFHQTGEVYGLLGSAGCIVFRIEI
jgi:hypothetical protein